MVLTGARPTPAAGRNEAVTALCERLDAVVTGETRDELSDCARQLVARGALTTLDRWRAGVDLSAGRAAFALIHDLGPVARAIAAAPPDASPLPPKRRLKDLVAFSVSDAYFSVRRALGVAIRR